MAALHNITHVAGDTFQYQITWQEPTGTPVDLGGYSAQMQIREAAGGGIWATSTSVSPTLTIVLGGALGTIDITGTLTQTTPAVGYWDLQVSIGGAITTIVGGLFTVVAEVTQ